MNKPAPSPGEMFKRVAALLGVCPFARCCVTVNYYWYSRSRDYVKQTCLTQEHKKCTSYAGFVEQEKSGCLNEERIAADLKKHSLYRPCPWVLLLETGQLTQDKRGTQAKTRKISGEEQLRANHMEDNQQSAKEDLEIAREFEGLLKRRRRKKCVTTEKDANTR
jgi:hypothetical protein